MTATVTHSYTPRGVLRDLFSCRAGEVLVAGPAGTGKSMACLQKLHMAALVNPGMRGLVVRKTLASLGSTALVTWRQRVIAEALDGMVQFYGGSPQESPQYRYANGSVIVVGGMDKAIRIMSSEYDMIYVQEATELSEDDWESLTTRLRHGRMSFQQLVADCNPAQPTHWLKARADAGKTVVLESRHEDNPTLFAEDGSVTDFGRAYIGKLDALTGVRYLRLRKGLWAAADGLVYEEYDPAVHLVDRFRVPEDWTRWWTVDFGYVHPFCAQMWAEDPDGRLFLYREIYRSKRTVDQLAVDILCLGEDRERRKVTPAPTRKDYKYAGERRFAWQGRLWNEPKPRAVICDHDAEGRAVLERELGLSTVAAKKTVSDGIQAVQARLRPAGDGQPRIFIMRDACLDRDDELAEAKKPTCTADEMLGYVWDTGIGRKPKEVPLKVDDHGCLVAGSMVSTPSGPCPIEEIQPGDLVLTRVGARVVLASGMTDPAARVWRVELSTGRTLVGTGDHPVWTRRGWTRLDALRYGDRLSACPQSTGSVSTGSSTGAIRIPASGLSAATTRPASRIASAVSATSIGRSGRQPTVRSRTGARSTTVTSTRSTTTSRTWPASRSPSTRRLTARAVGSARGVHSSGPISKTFGRRQLRGMGLRLAYAGIASTPPLMDSATTIRSPASATAAAACTSTRAGTAGNGSARTTAGPQRGGPAAWTTRLAPAGSAPRRSWSTSIRVRGVAGVTVLRVYALDTPAPVFNLTVADRPEFYAQGVLVHNCDALRYVVAHRDLRPRARIRWM